MGWARGTEIMDIIVSVLYDNVDNDKQRMKIYEEIANAFWENDCDTLDECTGIDPQFDKALRNIGYFEDQDEEEFEEDQDYDDD